jgi:hypothetical protein
MDFGKMKVVELRAELQARGLDTKGKCLARFSGPNKNEKFYHNRRQSGTHRPIKGGIGLRSTANRYVEDLVSAISSDSCDKNLQSVLWESYGVP